MAVRRSSFLAGVLLLASLGLWCSCASPPCPESCTCLRAPLLNCSSSGLSSVPQLIQDSVTELDLSHNLLSSATLRQPHPNLSKLWLGNNSIPHFSLCIERSIRGRHLRLRSETGRGSRCLTWAPSLQLLSAERNLLEQLPAGLDVIKSLKILQLSFNRISSLEPGDLGNLHQLQELHLQHNLITNLHPQMFQNLDQLRILDLRFNRLTNMQQLTYLTLHHIGADVKLDENRWRCDCNMRGLRRQMAYGNTRGQQSWNIICTFPSNVSGKDLLQLDEEDLKCLSTENNLNLHQDVTVYSGAEILLSCSAKESVWWTPSGRASVSQHEGQLLISDFSEGDEGLYVCVSEEGQVLSVFNLQISKTGGARKARSLPGVHGQISLQGATNGRAVEAARSVTQSNLALAVCLSIFFTFLLAFILGVLARPCLERLWGRVIKKKAPPETHTATSVQQRQYDNQAFSSAEEPGEIEPHRERRVTFSTIEITEESNLQYYDAGASADQESISSDKVFEYQAPEVNLHKHPEEKQRDDSSSDDLAVERLRNMKFEHIPDPDEIEERRSLSSSSNSSQNASEAYQMTRDHAVPKSLQLVEDLLQKTADSSIGAKKKIPQISMKGKNEFLGSTSLHTNKTAPTGSDVSQDDEELFEFSDGGQSPSAKASSVLDSFSSSHQVNNSYDSKRSGKGTDFSSSSDSSDSDREPMHTKIKKRTKGRKMKVNEPAIHSPSSNSESEEKMSYVNVKGRINIERLPFQKSKKSNSNGLWPTVDLEHIPRLKRRLDIKALLPGSDSSSCSDSEDEPRGHGLITNVSQTVSPKPENQRPDFEKTQGKLDAGHLTFQEFFPKTNDPDGRWPAINLQDLPRIKRRINIKAPTADSDSSSSADSEDETRGKVVKQKKDELPMAKIPTVVSPTVHSKPENSWPPPNLGKTTDLKKSLDIKALSTDSDSSSSSDSDNERKDHMTEKKQKELHISKLPTNVTTTQKAETQWPAIDIGRFTRIKRRLDIKAPAADSDSSSSSESEDETRGNMMKQKQEELLISKLPAKVPPSVHAKPEKRWPPPDVGKSTEFQKSPDIKALSTDSSSSSDSDSERKHHMTEKKQEELHISKLPTYVTTTTQKAETQWPALDLGRITQIKRRLDIKAPKADSDSSSSSESEDETRGNMMRQKQQELLISKLPAKVPPSVHAKPEKRWPPPDVGKTDEFKRPLDIKPPSTDSDSSSSSDSDNEREDHMTEKKQKELHISKLPTNVTTTQKAETPWPALDLGRFTRIKRRLDIKAPTADSDSSSSSESEDETRGNMMKQKQEELLISKLPAKVPPSVHAKPEKRWPPPDVGKSTEFQKSPDIKALSTDSSSSSDSDSERKHHMTEKKQEELHISKLPTYVTTTTQKAETQWPALDLGRITQIKRRLDIKAPKADSDSSSSSESEDETRGNMMRQKQQELLISKLPAKVPPSVHAKPEKRWPPPDVGKTAEFKRPLDIKPPSTDSDSSSSSDSDNEREDHMTEKKQKELHISKLPTNVTTTQKAETPWPALDLGRFTQIKRRLDIKAPTADSDSSSSSESEDETRGNMMKQKQEELLISKLPAKVPPSVHAKPEKRWPPPDVEKSTELQKSPDIKALSTDSSSSSDSDNERKDHMTEKKQEELHISKLPTNVATTTQKAETQWPTLDIGRITRLKRRLDIKAPEADTDSSSSSESEDGTRGNMMKQKQEELLISKLPAKVPPSVHAKPEKRWPPPDVGKTAEFKRPLDIKPPSTDSDSSSSSNSDNEREDHMTEKKQKELHISKLPTTVTTTTQKAETQWPALDLGRITQIKRRLDIKAPKADSDSSSSSESEDETRGNMMRQKQEELLKSTLPNKASPMERPKTENRWPPSDLGKTIEFKKSVDIKALSTDSDSSSSSDSDSQRKHHMTQNKQEELHISKHPASQTASQKAETQWPALDLGRITQIKRRLDIKSPKADTDSSSSSESEDETRGNMMKQKQKELLISKLPAKVPPSVHAKPEKRWPPPDVGKTDEFKRPLDIKPPSTDSDSSSSSDSDNEREDHMTENKQKELHISKLPTNVTTTTQKAETQWPALDLGRFTRIKRRLDIKAPTADSDSSSSSESEDETRGNMMKQKQEELLISKLPAKVPPSVHAKPEKRWPPPDLGKSTEFQKSPDIKALSTDSSSSSDSDSERKHHMTEKKQKELHISKLPTNVTTTQKAETPWPALDIGRITRLKRRLDIKAPKADSDSSSSSESEDETRGNMMKQKQEELLISKLPAKVPPSVHAKPERWSVSDLGKTAEFKRPLDIKPPSTDSDSSSSSDSDNERKGHMTQKKQEELHLSERPASQTASQKAENQWPAIEIGRITQIKRRLDIKAPTADSDSSSSRESEQKELHMSRHPIKTSQMVSQKQGSQWPSLDLWRIPQFKRRLDIKAPTADSKSSSSSDSENETGFLTENRKAGTSDVGHLSFQETTTETYDPDRRWPTINLQDLPRIKRHLVIKAPSPIYGSSSTSDTKDVIRGDVMKQKQEELLISRPPAEINQTTTPKPHSQWPALDLGQIPSIKRRLDIKASIQHQSSLSSNESAGMTADPSMKAEGDRNLEGVAQPFTGHVDNKTLSPLLHLGLNSSSALGFKQSESQSSSSESENENSDHQTKIIKNMSFTSTASEQKDIMFQKVKGTNNSYSTKTDHNIPFEKYTVISGDLQNIPKNDTSRTSLEVEAELQSRWTTMNLGVSRFRKRLEIASHATESSDLKSQPPPDSPLSPSSESGSGRREGLKRMVVGIKERVHRGSSPVLENYQVNVSPTLKDPDDIFTFSDVVKQRINQNKSLRDSKDSTRSSEKSSNSSSSSDSDDETKDHSVTDLSRGVPRIKRRLDIKAPLPELNDTQPFFSQKDDLTKHTTVQSRQASTIQGQTEESLITYKRSIFKSSLPNTAFPRRSQTVDVIPNLSQGVSNDRNTSLASKTAPNTSFDDIIKRKLRQSRAKTDGDLMTRLRSDATLIHRYSSLGPEGASPSPSDIPYVPGNSSENPEEAFTLRGKGERKGLSALKAMSEQRRNWEVESDKDPASLFDAQDGSVFSHSQSEKSIEVFSQQSEIHSPSMSEAKREIDLMLLYGVPRYKRHSIGDSLTEASLPDPTTPQPND